MCGHTPTKADDKPLLYSETPPYDQSEIMTTISVQKRFFNLYNGHLFQNYNHQGILLMNHSSRIKKEGILTNFDTLMRPIHVCPSSSLEYKSTYSALWQYFKQIY